MSEEGWTQTFIVSMSNKIDQRVLDLAFSSQEGGLGLRERLRKSAKLVPAINLKAKDLLTRLGMTRFRNPGKHHSRLEMNS